MDYKKYASIPLKQKNNRVWRSYNGGALIDRWKGNPEPHDSDTPEEWIASTVVARGNNRPEDEGLSVMELPDGGTAFLRDLIECDKAAFLGADVATKYGDTALLIKMLDSNERLTIQVHPDKDFAKKIISSDFGKTEGWYVLGGRETDGEPGYVLFGFREGVTKEMWSDLFRSQDIPGMIHALHKVYVNPGDVFIIHGGVPHAIGRGCFLLEIQEPTDFTMRVEKTTPSGMQLSDMLVHQGVGEEKMLDCFHYDSLSYEETMRRWKITPTVMTDNENYSFARLIDDHYTDCFSLSELRVKHRAATDPTGSFYVAIVYSGRGKLTAAAVEMDVRAGDEIFIPASASALEWFAEEPMRILLCYPPR